MIVSLVYVDGWLALPLVTSTVSKDTALPLPLSLHSTQLNSTPVCLSASEPFSLTSCSSCRYRAGEPMQIYHVAAIESYSYVRNPLLSLLSASARRRRDATICNAHVADRISIYVIRGLPARFCRHASRHRPGP